MSKPAVVNIGFCGLGTVGQGVWKHLSGSRALLEARLGTRLELYRVAVRHPGKARAVEIPAEKLTTDPLAIATDPAVPIVCELIGGTTLAREVTLAALAATLALVRLRIVRRAVCPRCLAQRWCPAGRPGLS